MPIDDISRDLFADAFQLEEAGEYGEAAELYALRAFAGLLESTFQPGRTMRLAFAHTLEAISADVRGGNQSRAENLFTTLSPWYEPMIGDADDPILEGLLHEWMGDAHLMLESDDAVQRYQDAKRLYETQAEPGRNWAFEEEFDYAYWAFESFAESKGYAMPEDGKLDFLGRVEFKIALVEDVLPT
ncbi:hypothetical protein HUG10_15535 [Halorarum halophilum]|uniref:Tetratricopeptide repeat protein n=1 Tax=Halorarum halophilum TaxID=2743090 RepID=A0A7D5GDE4_9EURY|nr:hypothetical protein [Halobaculum halophilum]QLG28865.1 hypothetical protein HUG10_15535 [Halobaculum halophilum]